MIFLFCFNRFLNELQYRKKDCAGSSPILATTRLDYIFVFISRNPTHRCTI
ncbi:hypothetical protein FSU_1706 [Fibrobacter succinogenes subsp. succinogenes S85]|uniref:Uncharacterized protein n=1 Tax=Fibrobacter succinogenes (strain ATCC 19169 / S85) TaxID=59374 RepID=D9SAY1_FIBSS|nr:hypothetical protein FSU_1706 [Fibrobacter succinogenes subsp. succinogenes S85]